MYKQQELMEFTSQPKIKIICLNENGENIVEMIVLQPEILDKQRHIVSADVIAQGKELWDSQSPVLGIEHRNKKLELYPLQEFNPSDEEWLSSWNEDFKILSSIIAPQDMTLGNQNQRVKQGSWVLSLEVLSDEIWQKIQNNELTGASIGAQGLLGNENSHQRIFDLLPMEISLVGKPAIGRTFITKALEVVRNPYAEMACRLQSPEKFSEFRRGTRTSDGKEYSIIFGNPKNGNGWQEQAYRYDKNLWPESQARQHCTRHKGLSFEPAKEE